MDPTAEQLTPRTAGGDRTALVTGAAGAVGLAIVRRLLATGYRVRILDMKLPLPGQLPDEVEPLQGDIGDRTILARATQGADVVFHLAAKLHINNPDPSLRDEYYRINVEGTRRVMDAAVDAKVSRLVFFSTICTYGPSVFPNVLDETSPVSCDSWYSKTKYEAEQIVLGQGPSVVLRLAAVYGPRMKGNYVRLLQSLQKHRFLYVGSGQNRRTLVYDEDVAAAALLAAEHPQAMGQLYNVTDGQVHTLKEIVETMCRVLARRPPSIHIPVSLMKMCCGIAEAGIRCLGRRSPITRQLVDKLVEDVAVTDAKIERELHYRPQVDLARGWRQVAEALAETPATNSGSDQSRKLH